jgi:hypothetical protein
VKESPIFVKSFETVLWLLEHTAKFPKHQRFVMAKRIEDAALSFQDELVLATKTETPLENLRWADYHLQRPRVSARLCLERRPIRVHVARLRGVGLPARRLDAPARWRPTRADWRRPSSPQPTPLRTRP